MIQISKNDLNTAQKNQILQESEVIPLWEALKIRVSQKNQYHPLNFMQSFIALLYIYLIYNYVLFGNTPTPSLAVSVFAILGMIIFTWIGNLFLKRGEYEFLSHVFYVCAAYTTTVLMCSILQWVQKFYPSLVFFDTRLESWKDSTLAITYAICNFFTLIVAFAYFLKHRSLPLWILMLSMLFLIHSALLDMIFPNSTDSRNIYEFILGIEFTLSALFLDRKQQKLDYAYWAYFFGAFLLMISIRKLNFTFSPFVANLSIEAKFLGYLIPFLYMYVQRPSIAFMTGLFMILMESNTNFHISFGIILFLVITYHYWKVRKIRLHLDPKLNS